MPVFARDLIRKTEIVRSLRTKDFFEAQKRSMIVNARVERLFITLLQQDCQPSRAFGDFERELKILELSGYSKHDDRGLNSYEGEARSEVAGVDPPLSHEPAWQMAVAEPDPAIARREAEASFVTLNEALKLYLGEKKAEHKIGSQPWKRFSLERERVVGHLIDLVGDKDISEITRQDARSYREKLIALGKATSTVNKYIANCHAVMALAFREHEVHKPNPFANLKVRDGVSASERRNSFSNDEMKVLFQRLKSRQTSDELRDIFYILIDTGARLGEVVGLEMRDVEINNEIPVLHIRPNGVRTLKTMSSARSIPLVGHALRGAASAVARRYTKPENSPLFPHYADEKGNTRASAVMMKFLRQKVGIKDSKLCVHSLRHTMKDRLRNAEVPKDVRDVIQGHAGANVGDMYGNGFSLEFLMRQMEKITS